MAISYLFSKAMSRALGKIFPALPGHWGIPLFHLGEKRDTMATVPHKAAGVYTTKDNADWLAELAEYVQDAGLTGREVILYGEIPGLGYLLDMPPALSTFWPDLDSYRMVEYERDLAQLIEPPVIIVASPVAAYLGEDADGMNWFGVEQEKMDADGKLQI